MHLERRRIGFVFSTMVVSVTLRRRTKYALGFISPRSWTALPMSPRSAFFIVERGGAPFTDEYFPCRAITLCLDPQSSQFLDPTFSVHHHPNFAREGDWAAYLDADTTGCLVCCFNVAEGANTWKIPTSREREYTQKRGGCRSKEARSEARRKVDEVSGGSLARRAERIRGPSSSSLSSPSPPPSSPWSNRILIYGGEETFEYSLDEITKDIQCDHSKYLAFLDPLACEGDWAALMDDVGTGRICYFNFVTGVRQCDKSTPTFPRANFRIWKGRKSWESKKTKKCIPSNAWSGAKKLAESAIWRPAQRAEWTEKESAEAAKESIKAEKEKSKMTVGINKNGKVVNLASAAERKWARKIGEQTDKAQRKVSEPTRTWRGQRIPNDIVPAEKISPSKSGKFLNASHATGWEGASATWTRTDEMQRKSVEYTWMWRGHHIHTEMITPAGIAAPDPPVALLVHGFGASTTYWRTTAEALSLAGYEVHALDLLGQGRSDKPHGKGVKYSVWLWARLVDDYARHVLSGGGGREKRDVYLFGHSLGSLVVLAAASGEYVAHDDSRASGDGAFLSESRHLSGICLFNCGVGMDSRRIADDTRFNHIQRACILAVFAIVEAIVFNNPPVLRFVLDRLYTRNLVRRVLLTVYKYDPSRVDDALVESMYLPSRDVEGAAEAVRQIYFNDPGLTPMEFHWRHAAILDEVPLHLVWGDRDDVTPLSGSVGRFYVAMANGLGTKVTMDVVRAGHIPFDDNPMDSNGSMLRWLESTRRERMSPGK